MHIHFASETEDVDIFEFLSRLAVHTTLQSLGQRWSAKVHSENRPIRGISVEAGITNLQSIKHVYRTTISEEALTEYNAGHAG